MFRDAKFVGFACVVACAAALAACSSTPQPEAPATTVVQPTSSIKPGSADDFRVNVGDTVFFDVDQHSVRSDAQGVLQKQAAWLQKYPSVRLMLEGHCDERGTREYNIALGDRRAASVKEYLVSLGIDAARLQTKSYGKERPVAVCDDISCWSQNRRAVTLLPGGNS
jgi:peptidoglycan-associated lipoprotein